MNNKVTWQDLAIYLRRIRDCQHLSQAGLARRLGCSQLHIWRLEHGQRHPSKALLRLLERDYLLAPEDALLFGAWETMIEHPCESVDLEELVGIVQHREPDPAWQHARRRVPH